MKKTLIMLILVAGIFLSACSTERTYLKAQEDGLYASMMVHGDYMLFKLFYQDAPLTVMNFVGLTEGKFADNIEKQGRFYDGITFHRVVPDFVIQGGDPNGDGTGSPGYQFADEFSPNLKHDSFGVLSMANSGPNTNGSQFFITLAPTPHLDGKHSVFGLIVAGEEIPETVAQGDEIQSIKIFAKGQEAKDFVNAITWEGFQELSKATAEEREKQIAEQRQSVLDELDSNSALVKTEDGLYIEILSDGSGRKNRDGDVVSAHYKLKIFGSDTVIDDSYARNEPFEVTLGEKRIIPGWELALKELKLGSKAHVVIPPELAFGETGAGAGIPPNAFLELELEIVSRK